MKPNRARIISLWVGAALLGGLALWWAWRQAASPGAGMGEGAPARGDVPASPPPAEAATDVTFLVCADTHFGASTTLPPDTVINPTRSPRRVPLREVNRAFIAQMNLIAGKPYPAAIGGHVAAPRALLLAGDLTEDGTAEQWAEFVAHYGHTGRDAQLGMPLYAVQGNHDKNRGDLVARSIEARHGGRHYGWRWDGLYLLALGEAPDRWVLDWLERQLERIAPKAPIILWFHYPLLGPYSRGTWFADGSHAERLADTIADHRVLAIFHGHYHGSGHYRWRGHDVFNVGSPKHRMRSFAVVRVTDAQLTVASWNVERARWWWWHVKSVGSSGPEGAGVVEVAPDATGRFRPAIPYPVGF